MTKAELIAKIAVNACISQMQAQRALDAATDAIMQAMKNGDRVSLPGFAVFDVGQRKERKSTDPRTRAPITVPAKKVPRARFSSLFKDML